MSQAPGRASEGPGSRETTMFGVFVVWPPAYGRSRGAQFSKRVAGRYVHLKADCSSAALYLHHSTADVLMPKQPQPHPEIPGNVRGQGSSRSMAINARWVKDFVAIVSTGCTRA